ncbi:MAG: hypothetical protein WCD53_22265 [Microcoleus sp.]
MKKSIEVVILDMLRRVVINSSVILSASFSFIFPVAAQTSYTFMAPKVEGRPIDHCINSYRYPDRCNKAATKAAADQFCKYKGYERAIRWYWNSQPEQPVIIWTEGWSDGQQVGGYKQMKGTGVFEGIECTK